MNSLLIIYMRNGRCGPIGRGENCYWRHQLAVLGARKQLSFSTPVLSDCAPLNTLIAKLLKGRSNVRFMRDVTRGGLAAILNELAVMTGCGIIIGENKIPIDEPVKGLCEIPGFDPLNLANEGKVLIVVDGDECENALEILRSDPLGKQSEIIGQITGEKDRAVVLNAISGGKRLIETPSGQQFPRIC